ncbi:hypothetical protein GCM10010512_20620 [Streptomyces thermoviolaceus subsp. thermoviolaceus]|nr:hypothetical protein GCM10010512_20620 [Streptomyces thermoviolaceus subsp. thermoviolaceus]
MRRCAEGVRCGHGCGDGGRYAKNGWHRPGVTGTVVMSAAPAVTGATVRERSEGDARARQYAALPTGQPAAGSGVTTAPSSPPPWGAARGGRFEHATDGRVGRPPGGSAEW